jgi:DNA-binding HxlR family transcriptional regulator
MSSLTGRMREEVEEIILQGIDHVERRNILKIIGSAPDGVIYSEILYELSVNTGKLNYHLRLLEGLIERDVQRRYHLTKLGKKALMILDSMTEDLDEEALSLVSTAKSSKEDFINNIVSGWSKLVLFLSFTALLGFVVFVNIMVGAGETTEMAYLWLIIPLGLLVAMYLWLEKVKKEAPERLIQFLKRLGIYK